MQLTCIIVIKTYVPITSSITYRPTYSSIEKSWTVTHLRDLVFTCKFLSLHTLIQGQNESNVVCICLFYTKQKHAQMEANEGLMEMLASNIYLLKTITITIIIIDLILLLLLLCLCKNKLRFVLLKF